MIAAAGALLWAFHPVQTSSVTYLVQRMAVLSGLFEFLAFGLYLRARRRESGWAYGGAALAYFLALFSKESAATLPVLIGLYEWLLAPSEPSRRRRARAIALGIACLPPLAMALFYALDSPQHFSAGLLPGRDFTLFQRVLSAPRMYGRYLALLAFPYPQALDYWLQASRSVLHPWTTLPATLALVGLLGAVLVKRQKAPVVCFAAMGFLVALGPESTFLNLEFFYEHRLYVASAFVVPLVPAGLGLWVSRQEGRGRRLAVALFCLLMAACAVRSGLRNREWRDPLLLWQKTLEVRPHNPRALLSVGLLLERRGEVTSAEEHFRRAIVAGPTLPLPHYDLGNLLARRGKLGEAITHYRQATSLDPKYSGAWHNLANALALAGDLEGAAAAYRRALRLDPDLLVAYEQLAAVLSRLGRGNGDEVAHLKQRYLERSCALGHAGACRHMGKDARGPKGLAP